MQDSEGNNLVPLPPVSIPNRSFTVTDPFQGGYDRRPRCVGSEGEGRFIGSGPTGSALTRSRRNFTMLLKRFRAVRSKGFSGTAV
jgi:hypothetical protein